MRFSYPELQKQSCFRTPDWRWRRACSLVDGGRNFCRSRDDEETGRAVYFLRDLRRGLRPSSKADLLRRSSDIHAAQQLHEEGGTARLVIQARVLAGQSSDEIAKLTCLTPSVIDTYEALFFHCREFLGFRDWIAFSAIGNAFRDGSKPDPGVVLKSFAYRGGPMVLEAVLPYLAGGKSLWDAPPDLSTPEGRREQSTRLAVAAEMLPWDAKTCQKLHRIRVMMAEHERKPVVQLPPAPLFASVYPEIDRKSAPREGADDAECASPASKLALPSQAA